MTDNAWTDLENDLIVADYFAMLSKDLAEEPYNKSEHRRLLKPHLQNRTDGSIEFKHQNISAVLKGLGETWISGYKPAFNFQASLVEAVSRWFHHQPEWWLRSPHSVKGSSFQEAGSLYIGPPPTVCNQPPPTEHEQMQYIAHKFDAAGRDALNRALGKAGEELILEHERATLTNNGRRDLAKQIRWVSIEDGDGAGYDIASFESDGRTKLIEVKTTNGWERTPFHISRNELSVAEARRDEWCLTRLWNFSREPKAFELRPPLERHVLLTATSFQASFS